MLYIGQKYISNGNAQHSWQFADNLHLPACQDNELIVLAEAGFVSPMIMPLLLELRLKYGLSI